MASSAPDGRTEGNPSGWVWIVLGVVAIVAALFLIHLVRHPLHDTTVTTEQTLKSASGGRSRLVTTGKTTTTAADRPDALMTALVAIAAVLGIAAVTKGRVLFNLGGSSIDIGSVAQAATRAVELTREEAEALRLENADLRARLLQAQPDQALPESLAATDEVRQLAVQARGDFYAELQRTIGDPGASVQERERALEQSVAAVLHSMEGIEVATGGADVSADFVVSRGSGSSRVPVEVKAGRGVLDPRWLKQLERDRQTLSAPWGILVVQSNSPAVSSATAAENLRRDHLLLTTIEQLAAVVNEALD